MRTWLSGGAESPGRRAAHTYTCRVPALRNPTLRTTSLIALVFALLALLAALFSVFVMGSRPWGCSMSSQSTAISCDWVTSRWVAAIWLVAALVIGLISFKRWALALAAISIPLIAFSELSYAGLFTLAPAAFWLGCALWLWSRDRRLFIALSAVASVALVTMGVFGVLALYYLAASPT
ncbi:MAG: hypothetical protein QOJ10_1138 [Chloroflexota bacterium]|jgi:hypothetical protein|nr:hypothetical protein [Chloroflexota bacterium]